MYSTVKAGKKPVRYLGHTPIPSGQLLIHRIDMEEGNEVPVRPARLDLIIEEPNALALEPLEAASYPGRTLRSRIYGVDDVRWFILGAYLYLGIQLPVRLGGRSPPSDGGHGSVGRDRTSLDRLGPGLVQNTAAGDSDRARFRTGNSSRCLGYAVRNHGTKGSGFDAEGCR